MILLLDVETTGLDPGVDRITELGVMAVTDDFKEVAESLSCLVHDDSYPVITPEITELTGITDTLLKLEGIMPVSAMRQLQEMIDRHEPHAVIAYNAQFDQGFINAELARHGVEHDLTWLCAMTDVRTNLKYKSWKLMHLALDYGVAIDPTTLHRAINDVEVMRKMLIAAKASVATMMAYKLSPAVYIRAMVKKPWDDDGASTTLAKKHGFTWEKARGDDRVFDKAWVRLIKEIDLKGESFPFETKTIGVKNVNTPN